MHCPYGLCPRDLGKRALLAGERCIRGALYQSSTVLKLYKKRKKRFFVDFDNFATTKVVFWKKDTEISLSTVGEKNK